MNAEEFSELQYWDSCIGRLAEKLSVMLPTIPQTQDRDLCFLPYTKLPYSELPVGIRIRPNTGWFEEMRAIRDTESEQAEQGEGKAERDKTPGTESGEGDSKPSDTKNPCGAPAELKNGRPVRRSLQSVGLGFTKAKRGRNHINTVREPQSSSSANPRGLSWRRWQPHSGKTVARKRIRNIRRKSNEGTPQNDTNTTLGSLG